MYFSNQKLKKSYSCFFLCFTTTIFSRFLRPIFVRKRRLKSLNQIYRYLRTADGLVVKTTMKDWRKLTVETWSQKLGRMAGLGLRIRQRMLTICCFWYFLAIFFQSNPMPNTATFWTIWDHISTVSFVQSFIFVKDSRLLDV